MATKLEVPKGACPPDKHQYMIWRTLFEIDRRYEPIKAIGKGAYGVVCSARDARNGAKVAIKKIANAFENTTDARRTLREMRLLRRLRPHDNIIAVQDIMRPPNRLSFNDVYIVYELMDTDLHQIIRSSQPLSDDHFQYFIYQLLRGLKYIHSANVLHRDLKPSNLLLNASCDLKICDFGLARACLNGGEEEPGAGGAGGAMAPGDRLMTEYVVTRWYRAPELLLSCEDYTSAIDVWSVGCIFAELLGRKPIFPGKDYLHQLRLIMGTLGTPAEADLHFISAHKARSFLRAQPPAPRACLAALYPRANPLALNLIDRMLVFDPAKRITVAEALEHPYLSLLHDPALEPAAPAPVRSSDLDDADDDSLTEGDLREKVWQEMLHYHPESASPARSDSSSHHDADQAAACAATPQVNNIAAAAAPFVDSVRPPSPSPPP